MRCGRRVKCCRGTHRAIRPPPLVPKLAARSTRSDSASSLHAFARERHGRMQLREMLHCMLRARSLDL